MRYGRTALEARLALADLAERSLDLQYYIWDADVSGHLLADRVIRAADRGVRVRVLLDDNSIVDRDTAIAQLSAHPNIEIRAFNPFRDRGNRWQDFLTDPSRVNRRSHNKLMIADNAIVIVGGRNIADHYFGVHGESNYRDLDTVAVGPVVRDASVVFDDFWNSAFAVPYAAFVDTPPTRADADAAIAEMRAKMANERLPYPIDEEVDALTAEMKDVRDTLIWAPVRVLYDPPEKAQEPEPHDLQRAGRADLQCPEGGPDRERLLRPPRPRGRARRRAARPGGQGPRAHQLPGLERRPRRPLGVPEVPGRPARERGGDLRAATGLHHGSSCAGRGCPGSRAPGCTPRRWSSIAGTSWSEATISTRARPTSTPSSRCSSTVPKFAEMVAEFFDDGVKPENSYRVTLERGRLRWTTSDGGTVRVYTKEPETSWWRRFKADALGLLPIHSML